MGVLAMERLCTGRRRLIDFSPVHKKGYPVAAGCKQRIGKKNSKETTLQTSLHWPFTGPLRAANTGPLRICSLAKRWPLSTGLARAALT